MGHWQHLSVWDDNCAEWTSDDGTVFGTITMNYPHVTIDEWNSSEPGQGNTTRALEEMNEEFPGGIAVNDPGEEGSNTYNYWMHLFEKGLVSTIYDAEGDRIAHKE